MYGFFYNFWLNNWLRFRLWLNNFWFRLKNRDFSVGKFILLSQNALKWSIHDNR